MTVAMTVGNTFLSILRLPPAELPEMNNNLHPKTVVSVAGSVTGKAFTRSYETPLTPSIVKPDNLTGIGRMPEEFRKYCPGRNRLL